MNTEKTAKTEARKRIYEKLAGLTEKAEKSRRICARLLTMPELCFSQSVAAYFALDNEVNVDGVISALLAQKKTVAVPVTGETIEFVTLTEDTQTKRGKFGVREPVSGERTENFDVILVPMVAFDGAKNRLGHGKGYYDRFLEGRKVLKIGVAFEAQEEKFECAPNDIKMDIIVTEERILR